MSLVNERVYFETNSRSLTLENEPRLIDAFEKVALLLGATQDECVRHKFTFNFKNTMKNELALDVLENIWKKLPEANNKKIIIRCMDNVLHLEGDDEKFKVFVAFIKSIDKEFNESEVNFSKNELYSFYAAYDIAEKLEILPT